MSSEPLHIVRLDGIHTPSPIFTDKFQHTYKEYPSTPFDEETIISRLQNADVVITTVVPISASVVEACPKLKLVSVLSIGSNHISLPACRKRGIPVCNVPAASNESVAEHAIALYFALRRRVVRMHEVTARGSEWERQVSLKSVFGDCPRTCREEVATIVGGGELGTRVGTTARALGMRVQFAERKGVPVEEVRDGRVVFYDSLRTSTVIFLTVPLSTETANLISTSEFSLMQPDAIIINVSRGGIVDEQALVQALVEKRLAGAATDVFLVEPANLENSPLVKAAHEWEKQDGEMSGRLVLSPHLAWWAKSSIERLRAVTGSNIENWARGEPQNLVA